MINLHYIIEAANTEIRKRRARDYMRVLAEEEEWDTTLNIRSFLGSSFSLVTKLMIAVSFSTCYRDCHRKQLCKWQKNTVKHGVMAMSFVRFVFCFLSNQCISQFSCYGRKKNLSFLTRSLIIDSSGSEDLVEISVFCATLLYNVSCFSDAISSLWPLAPVLSINLILHVANSYELY